MCPVGVSRAEQFFNIEVIKYYNKECKDFEITDPTTFAGNVFAATFGIWAICFLATRKGIITLAPA